MDNNNTNDNSGNNDSFNSNNNDYDILQLDEYLQYDQLVQYDDQQSPQQQHHHQLSPPVYDFRSLAGEALTDFNFANGKSLLPTSRATC